MRNRSQSTLDDTALVARACRGDHDAFANLYRRHLRAVECAVAAHTRDREARRDIVQDAFVRAFTNLRSLRDPAHFRRWVVAVARNAAIDERRRRRRWAFEPLDATAAGSLAAVDPAPVDVVVARAAAARVRHTARHLAHRDATVLALAGLGLGPAEIAPRLGVTANCAKVALHRARRRLEALVHEM